MRKLLKFLALPLVAALTACGGGGGSPGETNLPYTIKLTTAKSQLPINIGNEIASTGAYARFTTTLYVEARTGNTAIPGGEDIFACNVAGGRDSGALYYLDGKEEHMVEVDDGKGGKVKVPAAYRSIVLGSNAGGASFHFHAGDKAGTARITCSVTNPADKRVSTASVDIVVGAVTGNPANVIGTAQAPGYLGSRENSANIRNNVAISALVMDDANQPAPAPAAANVQVSIRPFGASSGARLISGSQSGSVLQVKTIGGEAQFSLSSGPNSGVILLEMVADRSDNNVSNGIQDPIMQLLAVPVVDNIASGSLAISDATITVVNNVPSAYALSASGGLPPYTWSALGGLPAGLTLSSSGVISGTVSIEPGDYNVVVQVTDSSGATVVRNMKVTVSGALPTPAPTPTPTPAALSIVLAGCAGDANTTCALPGATVATPFLYALTATGGDTTKPVTWTANPTPPAGWLTLSAAGNNGVLSGTCPAPGVHVFFITATRDTQSDTRKVSITCT